MDGVIVDTAPFHWHAWLRLSGAEGFPMTYEDFRRTFGWRNEELLRQLLGKDVSDQRVAFLAETKEELYRDAVRGRVVALSGSLDLLQGLRDLGYRQAVASSAPRANVDLILRELSIYEHFGAVLCEQDVDRGKPDPQVFTRAAELLEVVPSRCLVIEDAVMGVRAAKCAGMACLAVTTTHAAKDLSEADLVVTSLSEVAGRDVGRLIESR
jgi:HAD superfamily hydrolase (TIGR01509 family)